MKKMTLNNLKVGRWVGIFGIIGLVLTCIEFPLYLSRGGLPPSLTDEANYANFIANSRGDILTCVLLDMLIYVCLLVFLAGFRHLIQEKNSDYEWIGTLAFGAGLVYATLTLVADSLEGASALDTVGGAADPSAIKSLSLKGRF